MIGLAVTLVGRGGRRRALLVGACTAVVTALLLVVVAMLLLPTTPRELLFELVADPGVRYGTASATALLTLPPLLLLHQAVRLGTATRERRIAALRVAGATPGQVRLLGATEVGVPAFAGSLLGVGLFVLLRAAFGGVAHGERWFGATTEHLRLVPTSVTPSWWQLSAVVLAVTGLGALVGLRATTRTGLSPWGVTRQQPSRPPRPWGLLLLAAAGSAPLALPGVDTTVVGILVVGLAVLGVVGLAPWAAFRVGRLAESRARSAAMLLAARRVITDPRPVGRAAAAVGGIALVSAGAAGIAADLAAHGETDPFYVLSLALVGVLLLAALLVATGTLAVHSVESMLDRRRSIASLGALGMTPGELGRSQRFEAMLAAMPMAVAGSLLGGVAMSSLIASSALGVLIQLAGAVLTLGLVWLAVHVAALATRPWLARAGAVANLRTE